MERSKNEGSKESAPSGAVAQPPAISLPKGGGAIRGMGEKFTANPVTGTGSMSVPISTSPGRSGFGPQLSLSYDSGAGNGPFGFGWSLSLPSITRKTDKGLPKFRDGEDSDIFILSGAEDLVPVLVQNAQGKWEREKLPMRKINGVDYRLDRYRPRIEGLFARIERWTNTTDATDVFWRSISKDNITTWYGKTVESRIADPDDPSRIFSWLICQSHDDKGNVIAYGYKAEDSAKVFEDSAGNNLAKAHERNRTDPSRSAQRYLKRIRYGNRSPYFPVLKADAAWPEPPDAGAPDGSNAWHFEVVFDYGEHEANAPTPNDAGSWPPRPDPFSSYRAGFEVRTYRICQRVLMFHHFSGEAGVGRGCLVRSTDFTYSDEVDPTDVRNPVYTFLQAVTQTGYRRNSGGYDHRSLPPVEFEYTEPVVEDTVEEVDPQSLDNLPIGLDGSAYRWTDLHGEGIPGILTEQAGAWFYKRNLGPLSNTAEFAPLETVTLKPNVALSSGAEIMDLAGDGQPDVVVMDGPVPGLYEHDDAEGWQTFRPFISRLNRDLRDPNLKFIDLDGDGHADVLITEDDAFVWHASLAEAGFGPAHRVVQELDEEKGSRIVFADGTQSIYLADLSGDGLTDIVRIRNGEVSYWPNLGFGRFGAKVTMDNSPCFDNPDQFDQQRIRLADIDGSGTTDIIYLHRDGVRLYFNQSGNSWSQPHQLKVFPRVDDVVSIVPTDLLGNGTACLVWSSPLPGDTRRQMRYVDLMGGQKPHLLIKTINNLGAETVVHYAPSTKFYLQDKRDGKPWITKLPFPVHVVERVETYDHISSNRFVTRHAYHHGYFDGEEREFRGFGMVEQFDTEEFAALMDNSDPLAPIGGEGWDEGVASNLDAASHVPPVHTKTWFHTGIYLGRDHVSDFFAGLLDVKDTGEYYREPGLTDAQAKALLLDDTMLPAGLTVEEEREACRALKGAMLRQEVYALDGIDKAQHPYTVTEQNFTIVVLQPRGDNRHGVFFTHPREAISYHYERNPADPRVAHALTLAVDDYGNVLKEAAIGYGRRQPDLTLSAEDQAKQNQIHITYTENSVTNPIAENDDYRSPLHCESRTYELTGLILPMGQSRFTLAEMLTAGTGAAFITYEQSLTAGVLQKRLIEHVRTRYRPDDLGVAQNNPLALLPLGTVEPLALPGESYKLAFTPGLLDQVFVRNGQKLLPANPADVLEGGGADRGGYVDLDGDAHWWIPSGRMFFSPGNADTPTQELAHARTHFFLPHRYRDPFYTDQFNTETVVIYDDHKLLMLETRDPLGNAVRAQNDYRVLAPHLIIDPNGNRSEVAFDALGMAVATAVKGKLGQNLGDLLEDFDPDPPLAALQAFVADPQSQASSLLGKATTRIVYDLDRYLRNGQPPFAATLARETHVADAGGAQTKIQVSFSYSDGFGREIQKKIQAEPGAAPQRSPNVTLPSGDVQPGALVRDANGKPVQADTPQRWVGNGRTVFNNKGKPVRQYEPFFSATHLYEEEREMTDTGVSPIPFYDPAERVVATLHPNHTWEKVVFDPWRQTTYDINDTVTLNPKTDDDVKGFFTRLPDAEYLPTWHEARKNGQFGPHEHAAAVQTAVHADTPTIAHADSLGRTFLTIAHNRFERNGAFVEEHYPTRVVLDIEGNQREVIDAKDRVVMRYDYDMLGNRIHQASMEAGERWMLNDVAGNPLYVWNSRDHQFRTAYDQLRRPIETSLREGAGPVRLIGRTVYGETRPNPEVKNLRGKVVQLFDQAGVVTTEDYDFKGNLLRSQRQLAREYKATLDWFAVVPLEPEIYTSSSRFDALNRPTEQIAPDLSVYRPTYNEANLLEKVDVNLRGAAVATPFVTDIDYDAKGQRMLIEYGSGATQNVQGVTTTYEYDPLTFRLMRLATTRPAGLNGLATQLFNDARTVQDLNYTYDPAGNITRIADDALPTLFFANQQVDPVGLYTYDAVYRLIEAQGRESIGQSALQLGLPQATYRDYPYAGLGAQPFDPKAVRNYTQRYHYDEVGNFKHMIHQAENGAWQRNYRYQETSLVEPGTFSNRLSATVLHPNGNQPLEETYTHDAHGNMTAMPHLALMQWDFQDQLQATARQVVNEGTPETTYYVYDATGQRVRKVNERQNGTRKNERTYLGGFELYREYGGDGISVSLERESLHVMDDKQRIALVETRTQGDDGSPAQLIRYQLGNHLGSASLELDDAGLFISYEEYHPYGSTSYQAGRSAAEVSLKRYRSTGKEKDEETGFNYHGARYYAPWLGRWTASDSSGLKDGPNLYGYCRDNPIIFRDLDGMQPTIIPGEATGEETPEEIKAIAKEAGIGFKRPPTWSEERGMWDFGEDNLYKLTRRFDPGPAETVPAGPYSTNPRSGEEYDPFAPKASPRSSKTTRGKTGSPSEGTDGGLQGGKRTSGPLGGSANGSINGAPGGAPSGAPGGSGDGGGGGGGEESSSWFKILAVVALTLATLTVGGALLRIGMAALRYGLTYAATVTAPAEITALGLGMAGYSVPRVQSRPGIVPGNLIDEASQYGWRRIPGTRLSSIESALVNDVVNAPRVLAGRSINIEGRGLFTLDNWMTIRNVPWSQRLQDVYNYALLKRTSGGAPVNVLSGGGYSAGEAGAAEAGAAESGIRNIPYWP